MKNGDFRTNFQCYGYKRGEDGSPVIVEEEAEIVRMIFQKVLDGDSIDQIKAYLRNHLSTGKIHNHFALNSISYVDGLR